MPDPHYPLGTNYAIPSAPTQPAEEIATAILSFKYGVRAKEVVTQEGHPPASKSSLDSIVQNASGWSQDVAELVVRDKRRFLGATTELLRGLIVWTIKSCNVAAICST